MNVRIATWILIFFFGLCHIYHHLFDCYCCSNFGCWKLCCALSTCSFILFYHFLTSWHHKVLQHRLHFLCAGTGINQASIPSLGEGSLATKAWVLGLLLAAEVSLSSSPVSVCRCTSSRAHTRLLLYLSIWTCIKNNTMSHNLTSTLSLFLTFFSNTKKPLFSLPAICLCFCSDRINK